MAASVDADVVAARGMDVLIATIRGKRCWMGAVAGGSYRIISLSLPRLPLPPKRHLSFEDREIYPTLSGTRTGGTLLDCTVFTALTLLIRQYFRCIFIRQYFWPRLSVLERRDL